MQAVIGNIYKASDGRFVKCLDTYTNGIMSSAGFYEYGQIEELAEHMQAFVCVTYNAGAWQVMPFEWPNMKALDDRRNDWQYIKEVNYNDKVRPYIMSDGYRSTEVTL